MIHFIQHYAGWACFLSVVFGLILAASAIATLTIAADNGTDKETQKECWHVTLVLWPLTFLAGFLLILSIVQYNHREYNERESYRTEHGCVYAPTQMVQVEYNGEAYYGRDWDTVLELCKT